MAAEFLSKSRASLEALKSANLLKSLNINALIVGDEGVGKTTLAKYIVDAPVINGSDDMDAILKTLRDNSSVIIKYFDRITNLDLVENEIKKNKNRIIATSRKEIYESSFDRFFSLKIQLPPLRERKEDIDLLSKKFLDEAKEIFLCDLDVDLDGMDIDLQRNCHSLRKSIYKVFFENTIDEYDMMRMLQKRLYVKLGSKDDYRKNLYLYEIPLIKAGRDRFGSQSKMAKEFGINRNTLRKKINEYGLKI